MSVEQASKIIKNHYGNEKVLQVRKPHGKRYFIVDLLHGSFNFTEVELINLSMKN